jgi:hypothetical protein
MRFSASERSPCSRFSSATSCSLATAIQTQKNTTKEFQPGKSTRCICQRCQTARRETIIKCGGWDEGEKETLESSLCSPHVRLVLAELLNLTKPQVGEGVGAGKLVLVEGQILRHVLLSRSRGGGTAGEPCQRSCLSFPSYARRRRGGPKPWVATLEAVSEGKHCISYRGSKACRQMARQVRRQGKPPTHPPTRRGKAAPGSVGHLLISRISARRFCGNSVFTRNLQMPTGLLRWGRCCIPSCRRSRHGLESTRASLSPSSSSMSSTFAGVPVSNFMDKTDRVRLIRFDHGFDQRSSSWSRLSSAARGLGEGGDAERRPEG